MTSKEIFGSAKWVSTPNCKQPYIRGSFNSDKINKAEITICGLGFFELYINGKRVGDDIFVPAWTDYVKMVHECGGTIIDEEYNHRILCMKYDITDYINEGKNTIAVALGGGWFIAKKYSKSVMLCYKIDLIGDKTTTVCSDENLRYKASHITNSDMLFGERHDYRLATDNWAEKDFDDSDWTPVNIIDAPDSNYYIQDAPADKIIRYITPKIHKVFKNHTVYDLGENVTGGAIVSFDCEAGSEINVHYAEEVSKSGALNFVSVSYWSHLVKRGDKFIADGKKRTASPKFMWHAGRYISVTNNAKLESFAVIHSDVDVTSDFKSSDETLNWLYDAYIRTQLANMHCSIPSDCPHREGRGYTGDGQLACDVAMATLDGYKFYKKWLEDISDCQDRKSGHIQYTAPMVASGGGPGGWGCAIVHVPWVFYKNYGDKDILEKYLPQMLRYFDYLEAHSENELVTSDEAWAWCLGDWCTPTKIAIPEPFVNNYFYIKSLYEVIEIAKILGKDDIIKFAEDRIAIKKKALVDNYFDEKTGNFANNIQGANSFAVDIGLGDERTYSNMVKNYKRKGCYDTGIFGTDIVTRNLFKHGDEQLAFDLLTSKKKTSFYWARTQNATTLYEYWNARHSHSHPMFGAVVNYLFVYLLGIAQTENSVCYKDVVISPKLVEGLDFAEGYITTASGKIAVSYKKQDGKVCFDIEIPEGINAKFVFENKETVLKAGKNTIWN